MANQTVILGHTRLAVVGNDDAAQPLKWTIGSSHYYLVHNGEIYNYEALKEKLIVERYCTRGCFKTEGDSEVLLACLAHRGIKWTLNNIKGMFAFVLVESCVTKLGEYVINTILCRDAFGIKPLCFGFDESHGKLYISSEVQAMLHNIGLNDLQDVLPSTFVEVSCQPGQNRTLCEYKYETPGSGQALSTKTSLTHDELLSAIRSQLMKAVSARIPEGVRFAVLLSGGLDSSLICRLAADAIYPEPLYTFTITASKSGDSPMVLDCDCHFARLVAGEAPNIIHEEVQFSFQDGMAVLPNVVRCIETNDVAMIRAGVPLYLLSKHVSAKGFKVVLCGEGADESMAGYRLFEEYLPEDGDMFVQDLMRRLYNIDTSELQRVDRCTSAHGLEARVPFMDVDYVNTVMGMNVKEVRCCWSSSSHA